jgi:hypothetical protein
MINIRVLLIIRVLIILKHFGNLDFECYICVCVCVCRERGNSFKKNGDLCVERERGRQFKKKKKNGDLSFIYIYI